MADIPLSVYPSVPQRFAIIILAISAPLFGKVGFILGLKKLERLLLSAQIDREFPDFSDEPPKQKKPRQQIDGDQKIVNTTK